MKGAFKTRGSYEWGPLAAYGWRLPSSSAIELEGTLSLDPESITDDYISPEPLHLLLSADGFAVEAVNRLFATNPDATPEEQGRAAWSAVPRGEAIRGGTYIGNHSKLVDRWRSKGVQLMGEGVLIQGHDAEIRGAHFSDFGAWRQNPSIGAEVFPAMISGAFAGPDRHALWNAPADAVFEPATIADCSADNFDLASSNDQVTVFMITGGICNSRIADPWEEVGAWRHIMRRSPTIINPTVSVAGSPDKNLVQACTIYQCESGGKVSGAKTPGCNIGYYGDFFKTRGVEISDNDFRKVWCAIRLLLSPSGVDAEHFSHEGYVIQRNQYDSLWDDVNLDTLAADGARLHNGFAAPESRYIRKIAIEASARVSNAGATEVTRFPLPNEGPGAAGNKGCNPFGR